MTLRIACTPMPLILLLLTLPPVLQAQFAYSYNNGALTITGYTGSAGAVVIPSEVNGVPVVSMGDFALSPCPVRQACESGVTSVTIPDSVTNISAGAFYNCNDCLTNVTIGDGVTSIADNTFEGCSLTSITIPDSVTTIGQSAFQQCGLLTSVTIPNSVNSIGENAFSGCSSLTTVTIGNSVISIGQAAFNGCTRLTSVTVGSGVTSITNATFQSCSTLASVYFLGNAPTADSSAFNGDNYATVYHLPGTEGWGPFFANRPAVLWNPQVQPGSFGVRTNQLGFNITGTSNLSILVEACTSLANPTWYALQTNTLSGNPLYFTDPYWTNYASRFYRVSWP